MRNNNSSRFGTHCLVPPLLLTLVDSPWEDASLLCARAGKMMRLHFDTTGHVAGAFIKTYLLEKSRVVTISIVVAADLPTASSRFRRPFLMHL